jgi:hypothetical protein
VLKEKRLDAVEGAFIQKGWVIKNGQKGTKMLNPLSMVCPSANRDWPS